MLFVWFTRTIELRWRWKWEEMTVRCDAEFASLFFLSLESMRSSLSVYIIDSAIRLARARDSIAFPIKRFQWSNKIFNKFIRKAKLSTNRYILIPLSAFFSPFTMISNSIELMETMLVLNFDSPSNDQFQYQWFKLPVRVCVAVTHLLWLKVVVGIDLNSRYYWLYIS